MADNTEHAAGSNKGPGLMTMIKAVAFLSVIVLIEIAAASMLIPSQSETVEIANKLAAADAAKDHEKSDSSTGDIQATEQLANEDMIEVSLGSFHVVAYSPDTGSSVNVDFELYGIVLADDESEFYELYDASTKRISEQITITIRGTDPVDLTEPELGLIKRKILEKTNRALGKPLLHEAIFSEFSFVER